jgi:hypothetical protein
MVFANAAISQDIFVMRQLIYFLIKTHAVNSPYNTIMPNTGIGSFTFFTAL